MKVATNQQKPCESCHELTLWFIHSADAPLTLSFPHPILVDDIHVDAHKDNSFDLVFKKALWEPWPLEFQKDRRSKWTLDGLTPWKEGNLEAHLRSQFNLIVEPSGLKSLKRVREMIQSIFLDLSKADGDVFFSIQPTGSPGPENRDYWYLRIHPPILTSPLGTPLLVVSAIDNQLAEKLVFQRHRTHRENTDEVGLIFNKPIDENFTILSGTLEELQLFRYVLRLNSTRMVPNTWQEEYLLLEENSHLLATYLSPLYIDFPISKQDFEKFTTSFDRPSGIVKIDETCCAACKEHSSKSEFEALFSLPIRLLLQRRVSTLTLGPAQTRLH